MHTTLNEFLRGVCEAYWNNLEEMPSFDFWKLQYNLWARGERGVKIHDLTGAIMIKLGEKV